MITTKHLNKVFRTEDIETTALNDISLQIHEGEFAAVMGPSGCGKSTLLNVLGLLDSPSSGEYFLHNNKVSHLNEQHRSQFRKATIGFVFQSFNLIEELTVFENIELPLIYMNLSVSERKQKTEAAMERMNISHRKNHYPQQLSGGQQQRVAIARAVVHHPKLILADEPTGNLDSFHGEEVMKLLKELNLAGTTIVMVTHSERDAGYANKVIKLLDGKIAN